MKKFLLITILLIFCSLNISAQTIKSEITNTDDLEINSTTQSKVSITPTSTPSTPSSGITIYQSDSDSDSTDWPSWANSFGRNYDIQPLLAKGVIGGWYCPGNTTSCSANGVGATVVGATARQATNTNLATAIKRLGLVSAAGAGSSAGSRTGHNTFQIGNSSLKTGFYFSIKFSISDLIATGRLFGGLSNTSGAFGDVDPSTITNAIGVCAIQNDTTLNICYGGSAAQTPIDLGANFPADTNLVDVYEFIMYAPADGTVHWCIRRLNTGDKACGLLNGTLGTQLPDYNTMLSPQIYRSNGGTAAAAEVGLYEMIIQTFF